MTVGKGKSIWTEDGIHPNMNGAMIIANEIFNKIKEQDKLNKIGELLDTLTDCLNYIKKQVEVKKYETTFNVINDFINGLNIIEKNIDWFINNVYNEKLFFITNKINSEMDNLVSFYRKEQFENIEKMLNQQIIPIFNSYKFTLNEYIKDYEINIEYCVGDKK